LQALTGLINHAKGKLFTLFLPNKYVDMLSCIVPGFTHVMHNMTMFLFLCKRPHGEQLLQSVAIPLI